MHAEVGHVTARGGITRKEAGRIVKALLERYEKQISNPPIGKSFTECYDPVSIRPKDEYILLWEDSKKSLEDLGLKFQLL